MGILALVHVVVLAVLGLASLGLGVASVARSTDRWLPNLRTVSAATVFASLSAMCSGLSAVTVNLAHGGGTSEAVIRAWAGISEALVPGIFGFGVLAVAWGLTAVGLRRRL
jgi:hypothetical protein